MLLQLFVLFAGVASAIPSPQDHRGHRVSCTFLAEIKEVCRYNSKFMDLHYLKTEARIDAIFSPQGKKIANYTESLHIDDEPLTVLPAEPQEDITGQLNIQRSNNTGDILFSWVSPQSGGHPMITNWTESINGTDDLYGCTRRGWNRKEPPVCSQAYPEVEREKYLYCWFKCAPMVDWSGY